MIIITAMKIFIVIIRKVRYSEKSLISNGLRERKEVENRKEKIEVIRTKRRQLYHLRPREVA